MSMKIKLWGIRGSLPTPKTPEQMHERLLNVVSGFEKAREKSPLTPADYLKTLPAQESFGYGGHTACIEVSTLKTRLIIDGGSGLRCLGEKIMRESASLGKAKIQILMTHFHWDHLIGLPFFTPIFIPGNEIHFYAVQDDLEENVKRIFCKPNFPVSFESLASKIYFHKLDPRKAQQFDDITVTPYQLDHPDPCWGYRFDHGGKSFAHCVDSECTRASREQLGADIGLYQNLDLMIFDAQYTFHEASERINWGHASGPIGIDLAMRERAKRVLFIHHDPAASDAKIADAERQTREYYEASILAEKAKGQKPYEFDWSFAYESMEIQI
jgi:phosphoribosyl 1,2-cyclic phosphodiesterase